jgi:chromosome segregation ATPase
VESVGQPDVSKLQLRLDVKQAECDRLVEELQQKDVARRQDFAEARDLRVRCRQLEDDVRRLQQALEGDRRQHASELARLRTSLQNTKNTTGESTPQCDETRRLQDSLQGEYRENERLSKLLDAVHPLATAAPDESSPAPRGSRALCGAKPLC